MKPFGCTTFLKASLLMLIIGLSYAVVNGKKAGEAISRGEPHTGVSFVNFKEDKFSYLNITILGYSNVDWMPQCSFACLEIPTCFSYNLAAYPDINGKLLCEVLPSDKYNNSDKFMFSGSFHHFSIASPCSAWPCENNGTCLPLYEENSYKCVCKAGFTGRDCEKDIDECSSENECHVNARCTNTIGSYNCICKKGLGGDGRNCSDIDECSSENKCHVNATCMNTMGSYTCTCNSGYQGDGRNCADIDECSSENKCHVNATCTNTKGSYNCSCQNGFEGDGRNCTDIDECSSENECDVNARCCNTIGSYNCICKKGYGGGGRNCSDIDECSSENECHMNATCTNTIGSYNCTCKKGYEGDGRNCSVRNCAELYKSGERSSGVYTIDPDGSGAFDVFCDQTTAGGGWTVFQKRLDGSVDFYRNWSDYKQGFGKLNGEFWLGLDKMHRLTKLVKNTLRVDLEDTDGKTAHAAYDMFAVTSEKTNYQLSLGNYSGTAGDSLSEHRGAAFSTKDNDNDQSSNTACAVYYKGAWWYVACYVGGSTLNGLYYHDDQSPRGDGVIWSTWRGYYYSLKKAEMKIRPVGF